MTNFRLESRFASRKILSVSQLTTSIFEAWSNNIRHNIFYLNYYVINELWKYLFVCKFVIIRSHSSFNSHQYILRDLQVHTRMYANGKFFSFKSITYIRWPQHTLTLFTALTNRISKSNTRPSPFAVMYS